VASWSRLLVEGSRTVAEKFGQIKARGGKFGVIGSNHTTNEENFYLQKFAREASARTISITTARATSSR
jgi:NADH-quinone oxidoreductase subunit G